MRVGTAVLAPPVVEGSAGREGTVVGHGRRGGEAQRRRGPSESAYRAWRPDGSSSSATSDLIEAAKEPPPRVIILPQPAQQFGWTRRRS